jgi:hypothetical protein
VLVAITLGLPAALAAAVVTFLTATSLFTPSSSDRDVVPHDSVTELLSFLAVAVVVSLVAGAREKHRHASDRHLFEADVLSELAAVRSDGHGTTATLTTVGAPTPHVTQTTVTRADPPRMLAYKWGGYDMRWELEAIADAVLDLVLEDISGLPNATCLRVSRIEVDA